MNTTIYANTSGQGPDVMLLHGLFGQDSNLRGADSDYVRAEHEIMMKQWFTESHLMSLTGVGHWLHADQPEAFCDRVRCHLRG